MKRKHDDWDFQTAIQIAKDLFKQYGAMPATVYGFDGKENVVIPCPWRDERHKRYLLNMARSILYTTNVKHVIFMHEVWTTRRTLKEREAERKLGIMPMDCPDRTERLVVMSFNHDRQRMRTFHIKRRGEKVFLRDEPELSDYKISPEILSLLPPRGHIPSPDDFDALEALQKRGVLKREVLKREVLNT
jgi:hypothetical protein